MSEYDSGTERPYYDPEWLREQHVVRGRYLHDIADDCGVTDTTIGNWLDHYDIPKRRSLAYPPRLYVDNNGYERFASGDTNVGHHQLLAIADGADPYEVFAPNQQGHVHHENGLSWDNRRENVELLTAREHAILERQRR